MKYIPQNYFEIEEIYFREIFSQVENVWEVIPLIKSFIQEKFAAEEFIQNYKENVFVGENTKIEEGVYIKGPAIIGNNCELRHGSYIRENCIIGDGVLVGHATEIKNSIILDTSVVNHFNYIGDSVIGSGVNIAAGSVVANLRLDKKEIVIHDAGEKIQTGLKKFGAIIGDSSQIGVHVVINPGTILGKNTIVYPQMSITGVHKDGEVIR